ncbi:XRE family transcriptional regulator [Mesorhizobium sp. Pch-S]|uniref:helix-turn-helix domain-containing protein n=1 Tax=Mesorhizobium sp. Pch-S TaxID=2082387 RepID=UPI001FDEF622|nr:XRE family transcriptional regulator [Mesorhizobium sp. Pch-S]
MPILSTAIVPSSNWTNDWGLMAKHPKLGANLKALRQRHGWKLSDVSSKTGVAISTLSKVENDQMSLSYDKLLQIGEGLGLSMAELVAEPEISGHPLTRRSVNLQGDGLQQKTQNYDYLYLSTDITRKRMVPVLTRITTRSLEEFGPLIKHAGEEFLYVLEGIIEVHTEHYAPIRLGKGESIYIDSTMGHAYLAVGDGDGLVLAVCSSAQPDFQSALIEMLDH